MPLVAVLAIMGVPGFFVAVVVFQEARERAKFDQIRQGMALEEVIAVMGREPDEWTGYPPGGLGGWPPAHPLPSPAMVVWNVGDHALVWVLFDSGSVQAAVWGKLTPQPFWDRLRRWLGL